MTSEEQQQKADIVEHATTTIIGDRQELTEAEAKRITWLVAEILTDCKELAKHLRALDNGSMCSGCRQPLFLEDCTKTQCNSRGESEDERHMLMERDRRWDIDRESTWDWVEEGQQ